MKSIITLVALTIMASPSFAATKKTVKTTKTTTTTSSDNSAHHSAASDSSNTYSAHTPSSHDGLNWQAGLGLGTAGSAFHFGPRVHGLISVSKMDAGEILVGGETGFLFGPGTVTTWVIPIMAEGQFNFKGTGKITPYAGLSMGVSIFHGSAATVTALGTTVSVGGGTTTNFAMLAKGGLFFGEENKYFAELPLGTMGSAFAIFPTFGMRF